jgi:hypothetical protein
VFAIFLIAEWPWSLRKEPQPSFTPIPNSRKLRPIYIKDQIEGMEFLMRFALKSGTATFEGSAGEQLSHFLAFVANARAFYPKANLFKAK